MIENEKSNGYPIDDEELDNVSGGMRVQSTKNSPPCPVCGSSDCVFIDESHKLCRARGCGTIYRASDGSVTGVDPTIANYKP